MRHLTVNELEIVSGGDGAGTNTGLGIAVAGAAAALFDGAVQSIYN